MGLDMYLTRRICFANYAHDPDGQKLAKAVMDALGLSEAEQLQYKDGTFYIDMPAAYWRKANAIHGWFVNHVQDGMDECQRARVSKEQLGELRDLCQGVLDGKIKKEDLPPTSGFFFGNTTDDEYYRQDLQETVAKLTPLLEGRDYGIYGDEFIYQSSW